MLEEFGIGVSEEQIVVDDALARDDAEEVNQLLGVSTNVASDFVAAGGGVEDGEVDVRIGIGGVEEATEGDRIGGFPYLEDAVDVEEVIQEAAVLVPALSGADGAKHGHEGGEFGVDHFKLASEEGAG